MMKNLFLLGLLTWVSVVYAKHPVAQESIGDAETFKVEKSVEEEAPQRSVAGDKIKKKKKNINPIEAPDGSAIEESDSAVRYWEYSE